MPLAKAQDHLQVGGYGDYFRISQTKTNMAGLGARVGYKAFSHVMLEGEMNYDFEQAFAEGFTNPSNPSSFTFVPSNLRVLHGLFGPKIVAGHGAIRPFLTVKGGFINFRLDPRNPSFSGFVSSVNNLRANNVSGTLYPGAGLEGHIGPVGLRLEAGDEMYFAGSAHHNPRVAFGPFLRF
ncbi:MAG: hypothetical protein DMG47_01675 [Acidobacteria bacterium]|nr:MAG: hypothetical protein DMG47_01675 [Acidobacteriota bacterium]